jgi:F420-non-reducing hydrogenase iron-sulfur subunit
MKKEKQTQPAKKTRTAGAKRAASVAKTVPAASGFDPRIVAFVCRWCSDGQETHGKSAAKARAAGRPVVRFVSVMCSGRVQPSLVLKAFELGADGVIICGCGPGRCHYYFGNERQAEMYETSKKLVSLLGLEDDRLRLEWIPAADGNRLSRVLDEFTEKVKRAGPSPLRR